MPRFFVNADQIDSDIITVLGDDAHHISRSLRMAAGEHITVSDMNGNEYDCVLESFLPDRVSARILSVHPSDTEPPYLVHLYQALPKGEKLDSVIQKSVECGVSAVTTFMSRFCIAKEKGDEENKLRRRQRIALESAKQSGRGCVPAVYPTCSFESAVHEAAKADIALFCYEGEGTASLGKILREEKERLLSAGSVPTVSVMIGSEGGFAVEEVKMAQEAGLIPIGLGKRILRTETASGFVLSCLCYEFEL